MAWLNFRLSFRRGGSVREAGSRWTSDDVWGGWHSSGAPIEQRKGGPRGEDCRSAAQTTTIDGWMAVLVRLPANGLPAPRAMEGVAALEEEQAATAMNLGCERAPPH